jgi:hypothetical protein
VNDPVIRLEFPIAYEGDMFYNIPCDTNGFLLLRNISVSKSGEYTWEMTLYNTFFVKQKTNTISIDATLRFAKWIYDDSEVFLIFYAPTKKNKRLNNTQIIQYNIQKNTIKSLYANIDDKGKIEHFVKTTENKVYFSLQKEKNKIGLFYADFQSDNVYKIQTESIIESEVSFEALLWDKVLKKVFFVINSFESRTKHSLNVYVLGQHNQISKLIRIEEKGGKKFNNAKIAFNRNHQLMLLGTYDIYQGNSISSKRYFENNTTGFYSIVLQELMVQPKINYYNFLDFKNTAGNIKSMDIQKKKQKKGKKELSLEYNVLLHDIEIVNGRIYFVAEAYYAKYHNETSFYYDYYNRSQPIEITVFDGYNFFNAFIGCFNENGKLLWDNSFEIFNILTFEKEKRIISHKTENSIVFAYNNNRRIVHKVFDNSGKTIEGIKKVKIETLYPNDRVMDDEDSGMRHWYDNYFLVYGRELILNNNESGDSRRYVYYLNMMGFGEP